MVQTIHICGEISERKRRDIGERPYSPGPKRPPGRVFGTSTRHPSHAIKSAAAFLSGGEISERFWRDIGEMGVTLGPRGGNSAGVWRLPPEERLD
jgi:hypothetical protein